MSGQNHLLVQQLSQDEKQNSYKQEILRKLQQLQQKQEEHKHNIQNFQKSFSNVEQRFNKIDQSVKQEQKLLQQHEEQLKNISNELQNLKKNLNDIDAQLNSIMNNKQSCSDISEIFNSDLQEFQSKQRKFQNKLILCSISFTKLQQELQELRIYNLTSINIEQQSILNQKLIFFDHMRRQAKLKETKLRMQKQGEPINLHSLQENMEKQNLQL